MDCCIGQPIKWLIKTQPDQATHVQGPVRLPDETQGKQQTCVALSQVVALVNVTADSLLVTPVGSQAMLCDEVHFGGPDLDFDWDAIVTNHNSVEGAVAVGLGVLDVVLEAAIHRLPQVVHLHTRHTEVDESIFVKFQPYIWWHGMSKSYCSGLERYRLRR